MFLRDFCDIGKEALKQIINGFEINIQPTAINIKKADFSLCPKSCEALCKKDASYCQKINCNLLNLKNITNEEALLETENMSKDLIYEEVYSAEKNKIVHLSKYQILEFLTLHFMVKRTDGLIKNVSFSKLAKFLNCSLNTVISNSYLLADYNLIAIQKVDVDTYDISICEYKNYFLTKEYGGKGYMQITKEVLTTLLSLDNKDLSINLVKTVLKELLDYSNKRISKIFDITEDEDNYTIEKNLKEIKKSLPKRFYKKTILKLYNKLKSLNLFNVDFVDRIIVMKPTNRADGYTIAKESKKRFFNIVKSKIEVLNKKLRKERSVVEITDSQVKGVVDLCTYYGVNNVCNILDLFQNSLKFKDRVEDGKLLPDLIRNQLSKINFNA